MWVSPRQPSSILIWQGDTSFPSHWGLLFLKERICSLEGPNSFKSSSLSWQVLPKQKLVYAGRKMLARPHSFPYDVYCRKRVLFAKTVKILIAISCCSCLQNQWILHSANVLYRWKVNAQIGWTRSGHSLFICIQPVVRVPKQTFTVGIRFLFICNSTLSLLKLNNKKKKKKKFKILLFFFPRKVILTFIQNVSYPSRNNLSDIESHVLKNKEHT